MAETRNIVILGASFGGLGAAHYTAKHILPQLSRSKDAKYALHLVDPSTHFWWHIAAPRELVSVNEMKHEKCFVPIMDGFKQYPALKDSIIFHHGSATGLDTNLRTVAIKTHEGGEESLPYYALIIATGIRSPTPLTTLQGHYTISQKALEEMNVKLASAKDIVISGGGPVGVETAGEIGDKYHGKAKITLITSSDRLLPVLRKSLGQKAQKHLKKAGVDVLYGVKVEASEPTADGKTELRLSNGQSMSTDVYIPAVGVTPNTEFLPADLRGSTGYVNTNKATLRVDAAGPRVYATGDVAGVDRGGVLNLQVSLRIMGANLAHDLLGDAKAGTVAEKTYAPKDAETQVVPIGAKTGVGAFNGWQLPGFAIKMIKGKDYMLGMMPKTTEGTEWVKA